MSWVPLFEEGFISCSAAICRTVDNWTYEKESVFAIFDDIETVAIMALDVPSRRAWLFGLDISVGATSHLAEMRIAILGKAPGRPDDALAECAILDALIAQVVA